jgi:hypothetical protein
VVGGGSAGIGAALAAARLGVDTLLVEKEALLGGTSTVAGVNCWEPVAGATGIPFDIYNQLARIPRAVGIYSLGRHAGHPDHNTPPFPGGESLVDPSKTYADTLRRGGTQGLMKDAERCRRQWHGVVFEPDALDQVVRDMLASTGRCRVLLNSSFRDVSRTSSGEIEASSLADGQTVRARLWIDACGALARTAGAEWVSGEDPQSRFNEPDAPEKPVGRWNGVTLIFRITPSIEEAVEALPGDIPAVCWWAERYPYVSIVAYPNGDRNCNMLPTMTGADYLGLGETAAYAECTRRVKAYWHHLQTAYPEFRRYRMKSLAARLGVRETFRICCDYMLNENDLLQGIRKQRHPDVVALSDHMMDSHGAAGRKSGELPEPYGIPYRCLLPKGFSNLLVAGRVAGFSSIAASSCRLSRTMMQLGQAAGTAAGLALNESGSFRTIDVGGLKASLIEQNVQLT